MITKTGSNGRTGMFRRMVYVVLALAVMFSALPVGDAQAWSYGESVGRPGGVKVPQIIIDDITLACWSTISGFTQCNRILTLYNKTGPTVFRSPASTGTQDVLAIYYVDQWDGKQWVRVHTEGPFIGTINTGWDSYTFPPPGMTPNVGRGYFRVSWGFAWAGSNGASLGAVAVNSSPATDHACATIYRKCGTAPGYFQIGGYQTGQW